MTWLRIVAHDLRLALRSGVLPVLAGVLAALVLVATVVGWNRQQTEALQRARYQAMVEQQFRDQPDRHPHRVAHYGFLVFRPPAPLGFFDSGVDSYSGSTMFLEAHRQNPATFADAAQADGLRRFGELTMASVMQLFAPLFVLVLAGTVITREREMGTLPLLLCQGTSWATIVWSKLAAALGIAIVLLLPGLVLAGGWLALRQEMPGGQDLALRTALLVLVHLAYLAMCAAIGVVVSAWHRTSRAALLTLVVVWIACWVVLPRLVPNAASVLYPIPSRAAFDADVERRVRQLGDSHNPNDPRFLALRQQVLDEHGVSRVEDLPTNYNAIVMQEGEQLTTDAYREHRQALEATFARQARLVDWASLLSPYLAVRTVSMALAGTDGAHAAHFEAEAEHYRYHLVQHLNRLHETEVSYALDRYVETGEGAVPTRQRISRDHWQDVPHFAYSTPPTGWAVRSQPRALAALGGWLLVSVGIVAWTVRRAILVVS
jgi:ABC-2 type transport system permease protein